NTVAADPTVVAMVAAPFWLEPPQVADVFAKAPIPTLSLSALSPPGTAGSWFRLVPDANAELEAIATALADATPGNAPVCVARDGSAYGERLSEDALQILADAFHLIPVGSTAGSIHASRRGALL